MKIEYLADHENLLPTLAKWYFDEWGYKNKKNTLEKAIEYHRQYLNKDKIPLILIAIENDNPLGAAQLKYYEMRRVYPEKKHWLGGVYVSKNHRGKGIAKEIIKELIVVAKKLNVITLYLQTENLSGGLYAEMGWKPIEQISRDGKEVLVMEKRLKE